MSPENGGVREVQVTFDCADPAALSAFWREVLGYPEEAPPAPFSTWEEALDAWKVPEEHRNDYGAISTPDKSGPRLFFQKVPGKAPGSYTMDHSAASFVFDPAGRVRLFVPYGSDPKVLATDLKQLIAVG